VVTARIVAGGTVTLLLADVEGSTSLWEAEPETMTAAIARLDACVSQVLAAHCGVRPIEQGEGDSFVAVFTRASDAVAAAVDLQRADTDPIRLRIGVHTGEVQLRDEGNYVGPAINRTARLRNIGHGSQTLLSQAVRDLVLDRLPEGAVLLDLGTHRLRDLAQPEHVWQLCHRDLRSEFPPLRSLDAHPHNLPVQLTSFIGRRRELAELRSLLADTRLLTLTGSGGSGKTRLALQLVADVVTDHPDGTWWVELAPVADATLVAPTTARAVGFPDEVGRTALDTIERHVAGRQLLIVLDNCEHFVAECAAMTDQLLRRCPGLRIVATSREPLALSGETTYRVPSLSLPGTEANGSEAVELFVDRARRARPNFGLTPENSSAVEEICQKLDGLPLALELAAARLRALSPRQIADGLGDRFRLLISGSRTALPRQQTLRASVDWSYHLLTDAECVLFRRLSVFAGSFTLDAALAVGASQTLEPHHVFDLLALLVDKSLVVFDDSNDPPRYRLLETIRQYALERLTESGEQGDVRRHHRKFFSATASRIPLLVETDALDQALLDLDNFRAALRWSLDASDVADAVGIVNALFPIWARGRVGEGRSRYDAILPLAGDLDPAMRAWALALSANLDLFAQDTRALVKAEESVALARQLNNKPLLALALANLSIARVHLEGSTDRDAVAEYVALARNSGDPATLGWALYWAAVTLLNAGDISQAAAIADECLEISSSVSGGFIRGAKSMRAMTHAERGEPMEVLATLEGVLEEARRWEDTVSLVLATRGWAQALMGATADAARSCDEAIAIADESGQPLNKEWAVIVRGITALADGDAGNACHYLGEPTVRFGNSGTSAWDIFRRTFLVEALLAAGDVAEARRVADETIAGARERSSYATLGRGLTARARVALAEGIPGDAEALDHKALTLRWELKDRGGTADTLEVLAAVIRPEAACRLLGAAAAIRQACGAVRFKIYDDWHASLVAALRGELGPEPLERLWREGESLSPGEAIAYALRGRGQRKRSSTGWSSLTPSELDVARRVAAGLSNKEVATRLFISARTVQAHLTHIYAKLGISSRVELAREVARRT
jgi:predicted ATPase/class 3 adenylate cyclase/DNA-binding CsgD family transcriptional regulator